MAPGKPTPKKLLPLFAPMRYKVLKGGRLGCKSHTFAELLVERCLGSIPAYPGGPVRAVCLREVQTSIRESVRTLVIDKLMEAGKDDECDIRDQELRFHNGSHVVFKGLQSYNATNIKSLEGYDIAWGEEAQSLSHLSLRMLRPTIRKPGSELWFSYNPRYPSDAIDEFVHKHRPDNCLVIETSWRDNPHISDDMIKEIEHDYEVDPLMADHIWQGGYEVITKGSFYGNQLADAALNFRITEVSFDPAVPTYASMDLGIGDATSIWIFQIVGTEWHFLRFYESHGQALDHYTEYLKSLAYPIDAIILPHDAAARELQSAKSREFFVQNQGFTTYLLEKHLIEDGIAAVRQALPRCWFDRDGTSEGVEKLRRYRSEFNDHTGVFKLKPLHDENSHGADSFRYAVMGESLLGGYGPNRTSHLFQKSDWNTPIRTINPYVPASEAASKGLADVRRIH